MSQDTPKELTIYDMLLRDYKALQTEFAAAQAQNVCDACTGTGKPISGLPCMCGGTGRMSDAALHLREQLVDAQAQIDALKEKRREDVRKCEAECRKEVDCWTMNAAFKAIENCCGRIRAAFPEVFK